MIDLDRFIERHVAEEKRRDLPLAEGWNLFHHSQERKEKVLLGVVYGEKAITQLNFSLASKIYEELIAYLIDGKVFTAYLVKSIVRYLEALIHFHQKPIDPLTYEKITNLYRANRDNIYIKMFYLWYTFIKEGRFKKYNTPPLTYLHNVQICVNSTAQMTLGRPIAEKCPIEFVEVEEPDDDSFDWLYHLQVFCRSMILLNIHNRPEESIKLYDLIPPNATLYPAARIDREYACARINPQCLVSDFHLELDLSVENPWVYRMGYVKCGALFATNQHGRVLETFRYLESLPWKQKELSLEYWLTAYLAAIALYLAGDPSDQNLHGWLVTSAPCVSACVQEELYVLRSYGLLCRNYDVGMPEMKPEDLHQGFLKHELQIADNIVRHSQGLEPRFPFLGILHDLETNHLAYLAPWVADAMEYCAHPRSPERGEANGQHQP